MFEFRFIALTQYSRRAYTDDVLVYGEWVMKRYWDFLNVWVESSVSDGTMNFIWENAECFFSLRSKGMLYDIRFHNLCRGKILMEKIRLRMV